MIDINAYKNMTWETPSDELEDAVEYLLAEVMRLRNQVEALFSEIRRLEGDDGEWIE